jgi:hypothetical protein
MRPQTIKSFGLAIAGAFLLMLLGCSEKDAFFANTLKSDLYVQLYAVHQYDILWVLDNSPSMAPKNQYLHDNIQDFLNELNSTKAADLQMAVTTVDFFSSPGQLVQGTGGLTVVKSATSTNFAGDFQSIVSNIHSTGTSFWEQPEIQAVLAIQNSGPTFMRNGVPFIVVVLSDDDDWSCQAMVNGATACSGIQPENNPDVILYPTTYFINFFKGLKAGQNTTTTVFPIVGTANGDCVQERVGLRTMFIAAQVGGDTAPGGLCPDQIGNSLNNIAKTLANRGVQFMLSSNTNGQDIEVLVNSQVVPYSTQNGYYYDPTTNSIFFTGNAIPLNGDTIQILYTGSG